MYVRISGRIRLNAHSLNAQGGGGTNYIEITKTKVTVKTENGWAVVEVPAITGNMLKHWHFVGFVDYFKTTPYGVNLTERALRYNGTRFEPIEKKAKWEIPNASNQAIVFEKKDNKWYLTSAPNFSGNQQEASEAHFVKYFADADIHGFLAPAMGIRRVSLVKASFILPTEDFIREVEGERLVTAIKHNRVDVNESGAISSGNDTAQMLFSREYATGLYGFSIVLDLGLVGIPQGSPVKFEGNQPRPNIVIDPNERKARIQSALKALIPMLSGYLGANLARSFPVFKVEELIVIASEKPIPALVHGFYDDYIEANRAIIKNARALGFDVKAFTYKVDLGEDLEATKVSSVEELVAELLKVEGGRE